MTDTDAAAENAAPRPYTIIVGVSPSSKSPTALQWAKDMAAGHQGHVVALRAWRPTVSGPTVSADAVARTPTPESVEAKERARLERDVAEVLGADSDVECRLVRGGRRSALLRAARDADLLVVDAPRTLIAGPMFAHRLIYAATCPVVVMPPHISGEPPTALQRASKAVGRSALRGLGTSAGPGSTYRLPPS